MATDFIQMDLLSWGAPKPVSDIVIPTSEPADQPDPLSEEALALKRHPDTGMDGVTADSFERINLALPKNIRDTAEISLSCGTSGKWYCGWGAGSVAKQESTSFAAWPKFSDAYASKYEAFTAAAEAIQGWFATRTQPTNRKPIIQALKVIAQKIDPDQYERDTTCEEWRTCGYAEKCFSQSLDYGPGPVCFKDEETNKGKESAEKTLTDLCTDCHVASKCEKCCATCKEPCNAQQFCRWPVTGE